MIKAYKLISDQLFSKRMETMEGTIAKRPKGSPPDRENSSLEPTRNTVLEYGRLGSTGVGRLATARWKRHGGGHLPLQQLGARWFRWLIRGIGSRGWWWLVIARSLITAQFHGHVERIVFPQGAMAAAAPSTTAHIALQRGGPGECLRCIVNTLATRWTA